MKVETLGCVALTMIWCSVVPTFGKCPFSGEGFVKDGAAPAFTEQEHFKAPYSQCDSQGTCNIVRGGQQNLQGNEANSGPAARSEGNEVCVDALPPNSQYKSCQEAAFAWGGCSEMRELNACNVTCASCSPVFVSQFGKRSGTPFDIDPDDELAQGGLFYMPKLKRVRCKPYDVAQVANAARELFEQRLGSVAGSLRMSFHDAGDFDKWALTGGADGRFANSPEAWYGQSRGANRGLLCVHQLLGKFRNNKQFRSLSSGDAIQICAMVAVEIAGGPKFEDFDFKPGRVEPRGVTTDGMLPNSAGNHAMIRDYYYRMGLNDVDIVALMGAHTLGGARGSAGSRYTGRFTADSRVFDNSYFQQLLDYENPSSGDGNCDYFTRPPSQRADGGGCHVGPDKDLLQLPTDRALLLDTQLRSFVQMFARDQTAFFKQFAKSMKKLSELGKDASVQWCDFQ